MDTFETQFQQLSPGKQVKFVRTWGNTPWKDPKRNDLPQRKAWKRDLDPLPDWPRWKPEAIQGQSPLWMALRAKNRRAAGELLSRTPVLSRREGGVCALLTLQWAPDLLEAILDRTPGGPFYWLRHEIAWKGSRKKTLCLRGSLVMIAAALNDLPSLELLLRRGDPADYDFRRDRWKIVNDLLLDDMITENMYSPDYSLQQLKQNTPLPKDSSGVLLHADPLSAAVFCDAASCALRLLQEPNVSLTPSVRRALAITPENRTQQLTAQAMNLSLEEILLPEDFGPELDHSAFLPVLRRYRTLPRPLLTRILRHYKPDKDTVRQQQQLELFSLIDPVLFGDMVWEVWTENCSSRSLLKLAETLKLPLNRCRVSGKNRGETALRYFQIIGQPPEDGLSGLAVALLKKLEVRTYNKNFSVRQLLDIPGALHVLQTEHPHMISAWLDCNPRIPAAKAMVLKAVLNILKEVSYDL